MDEEKIIRAGKIASQTKAYAKNLIKKGMPLLEIAEKIEAKIEEFGGKPAFPVSLSIDNVAAHSTPSYNNKTLASGLLKVDLGVHLDGWIADTAFSIDLEDSELNKNIIKASEKALENALKAITQEKKLNQIGKTISETIESFGFSAVVNLSGHSIDHYNLHSGITVPNIDNKNLEKFKDGIYAIEPFATNGPGKIHDGKPSGIYFLKDTKAPRSPSARNVLKFIQEEYNILPFCSRWIEKKLGIRALFALKELEDNKNLHHFAELVEPSNNKNTKISQSEQTILISQGKVTVTTI